MEFGYDPEWILGEDDSRDGYGGRLRKKAVKEVEALGPKELLILQEFLKSINPGDHWRSPGPLAGKGRMLSASLCPPVFAVAGLKQDLPPKAPARRMNTESHCAKTRKTRLNVVFKRVFGVVEMRGIEPLTS